MKKLFYYFSVTAVILGMSACSQDEVEILSKDDVSISATKALNNNDSLSVIIPLVVDSNLIEMAKAKNATVYYNADDPDYSSNMFAIRELPLRIQARGNKKYLATNGAGKELSLSTRFSLGSPYLFHLKVLPASSGIPYLIYSEETKTPLSVGQYENDPNNKVLFARQNNSGSFTSADWDLIPSSSYKGYFAIESQSYLGQVGDNPWSVFKYVLETKNTDKLGYGQYTKKPEQEFRLIPAEEFTLHHIEFHKEGSTVTKRAPLKLTTYSANQNDERRPFTIKAAHYADEEYSFSESSALTIPISNKGDLYYRPKVEAEHPILPLPVAPKDDPDPIREKADMLYSTTNQKIKTTLLFDINGVAPANCSIEATSYLENYNVSAKYTAYMTYNHNGDERLVKISGTWRGVIYTTIRDDDHPKDLLKFFDLDTGDEIMRLKSVNLSPIIFK